MSRWFSWTWAYEDLDKSWTVQEFVYDWMGVQLGTFLHVAEQAPPNTYDLNYLCDNIVS